MFGLSRISLYAIAALIAGWLATALWLRTEVASARIKQAHAESELASYQSAASAEIVKRIEANRETEAAARDGIIKVSAAYDERLRLVRLRNAAARNRDRAVSAAAAPARPIVDATGDATTLPRCVDANRRAEFVDLADTVDRTSEKLIACQDYVRGLDANRRIP